MSIIMLISVQLLFHLQPVLPMGGPIRDPLQVVAVIIIKEVAMEDILVQALPIIPLLAVIIVAHIQIIDANLNYETIYINEGRIISTLV